MICFSCRKPNFLFKRDEPNLDGYMSEPVIINSQCTEIKARGDFIEIELYRGMYAKLSLIHADSIDRILNKKTVIHHFFLEYKFF